MKYLLLILIPFNLLATTISPYPNMETLQASADKIVYVESILDNIVQIRSVYKGRLPNTFVVEKYAPEDAIIFGDVELSSGKNYLLFLDKNNKPICLSYYIYEEVGFNMIPVEKAYEVHSIRGEEHGGYNRDSLLTALRGYGPFPKMQKRIDTKREAPSHCTWLSSGGQKFRWKEMPLTAIYTLDSTSCNGHTLVDQALTDLNTAFRNITYLNGGSTVHATCGGGIPTAVGTSYRNWINANYNPATGAVFFNDPCNEINNLVDCHGTLAFGGGYGIGTHNFRGETWYTMQYPFVVMNDGLDTCHCNVIDLILKHELVHTLGIGHISSNYGQALMNPFCCADIMQLDVDCLDYTYPCGQTNNWIGGASNNWMDAGNWTAGIPDTCHSVVIPEGDSVSIRVNEKGIAGLIEVNGKLDVKGKLEVFYE